MLWNGDQLKFEIRDFKLGRFHGEKSASPISPGIIEILRPLSLFVDILIEKHHESFSVS